MKTDHPLAIVSALTVSAVLAGACGAEHVVPTDGGIGGLTPIGNDGTFGDAPEPDLPGGPGVASRKADGLACAGATECRSGFCVDGVCCENICTGTCRSCALAGSAGLCHLIDVGTDPADECMDMGAASCGTDGTCDGAGACRKYPVGTMCAAPGCSGSMLTPPGTCNDAGTCSTPAGVSCGNYACDGVTCRTTCMMTAQCATPSVCNTSTSSCGGLVGTYYNNVDFTGPVLTRTDATVNFDWMAGSPATGVVDPDTFSIRWKGRITPRTTATYTFYLLADNGMELTVNDTVLIDSLGNPDPTVEKSKTIALQANQPVPIQLDYVERTGTALIRLSWSSPTEPKAVIPTSALSP